MDGARGCRAWRGALIVDRRREEIALRSETFLVGYVRMRVWQDVTWGVRSERPGPSRAGGARRSWRVLKANCDEVIPPHHEIMMNDGMRQVRQASKATR